MTSKTQANSTLFVVDSLYREAAIRWLSPSFYAYKENENNTCTIKCKKPYWFEDSFIIPDAGNKIEVHEVR